MDEDENFYQNLEINIWKRAKEFEEKSVWASNRKTDPSEDKWLNLYTRTLDEIVTWKRNTSPAFS